MSELQHASTGPGGFLRGLLIFSAVFAISYLALILWYNRK